MPSSRILREFVLVTSNRYDSLDDSNTTSNSTVERSPGRNLCRNGNPNGQKSSHSEGSTKNIIQHDELTLPNAHNVSSHSTISKPVEPEVYKVTTKTDHVKSHGVTNDSQYRDVAKKEFSPLSRYATYKKAVAVNSLKAVSKNWIDSRPQRPPRFLKHFQELAQKPDVDGSSSSQAAQSIGTIWNVGIPVWESFYTPFVDYRERLFNNTNFPGDIDWNRFPDSLRQKDFYGVNATTTEFAFENICSPHPVFEFDKQIEQTVYHEALIAYQNRHKIPATIASPLLHEPVMQNGNQQQIQFNGHIHEQQMGVEGNMLPPSVARCQPHPPGLTVSNNPYPIFYEQGERSNCYLNENRVRLNNGEGTINYENWQKIHGTEVELPRSAELLPRTEEINLENYGGMRMPTYEEGQQPQFYYLVRHGM